MSITTKITWAHGTASPWHGCEQATYIDANGIEQYHPGCENCWAMIGAPRNPRILGVWGDASEGGQRIVDADFRGKCRRMNEEAQKAGERRRVFPSICDPFESWNGKMHNHHGYVVIQSRLDGVRTTFDETLLTWEKDGDNQAYKLVTMGDLRSEMFATFDACPFLDFLLLTKRPQNVRRMWSNGNKFRSNVWVLTSVSDQATADAFTPLLLEARDLCPVLGFSAEPLLSGIDLYDLFKITTRKRIKNRNCPIDFVIIGCESNKQRVGRLPDGTEEGYWRAARSLIEQCRTLGVACFHKQAPLNGKLSHDPNEWPEWARVQDLPKVAVRKTRCGAS